MSRPPTAGRQRAPALVAAGILVVTVAVYARAVGDEFINFDDTSYVVKNLRVQEGLTTRSVRWALTSTDVANWHPLTWLSLECDAQLFGLSPWDFHLTNVQLHATSSALLLGVLFVMTGALWPSALVAALFAWHPLHVESVAWAAERKDVLSGLFWVLTLWAYAHFARRPSPGRYMAVCAALAIGLAAKPMLVTLPCVLFLLDYWPLGRLTGREDAKWLALEKTPLLAIALAAAVVTVYAQSRGHTVISSEVIPFWLRVENALVAYAGYVAKTVWPEPLVIFYPLTGRSLPAAAVAGSFLGLAAVTIAVVILRRTRPYLPVGWLWYLATLLPVIGLVQVGAQAMADRYTYIPLVGLFIALAWGSAELACRRRWVRVATTAGWGAALAGCVVATQIQLGYWHDSLALWEHALMHTRLNYVACSNYAHALASQERWPEARFCFNEARELRPELPEPYLNLGVIADRTGHPEAAERWFREAVAHGPSREASIGLAALLTKKGSFEEAARYYDAALQLNEESAEAHEGIAWALDHLGRPDEALRHYARARELKPRDPGALVNLGLAFKRTGRGDEALACFRAALALDAGSEQAHQSLAEAYAEAGRADDAIRECEEVLRTNPKSAVAHALWGAVLQQRGDAAGAEAHFAEASRLDPALPEAHSGLGSAAFSRGDLESARRQFEEAVRLKPSGAAGHKNLGLVLARMGDLNGAAAQYTEALRLAPGDVVSRCTLATTLARAGRQREAQTLFRQVNGAAWGLATDPDVRRRNGPLALAVAKEVVQATGERDADTLDTLGAAYAETGDFAHAQDAARKALALYAAAGRVDRVRQVQNRLRSYEAGQPARESSAESEPAPTPP